MADFKRMELSDILDTPDLKDRRIEITDVALVASGPRERNMYLGFFDQGERTLFFYGDTDAGPEKRMEEYLLLKESTTNGEPVTVQGTLKVLRPGSYFLVVSGVRLGDIISKDFKEE